MTLQLHFTVSPVQEFVTEARKTIDLWSGSYLLSYLVARAIAGAIRDGAPEDKFFPDVGASVSKEHLDQARSVGSIPNRFSLDVETEEQGRAWGSAAKTALNKAWSDIAASAWRLALEKHPPFASASDIWDRQVEQHWSVSWVVSADPGTLNARKQMRTFEQTAEPGEKCTVCGRRQALGTGKPREFWQQVAKGRLGPKGTFDGKERLCAVCLAKRLFPLTAEQSAGWKVPAGFPSTVDFAAAPWKREVSARAELGPAVSKFLASIGKSDFKSLQGGYLYEYGPYHAELVDGDQERRVLGQALGELRRAVGTGPRNFYAVLSMDGDRMGARLRELKPKYRVEMARMILKFSSNVKKIVEDGGSAARLVYAGGEDVPRLVYAGGEDVLALLPVDVALQTALALRQSYTEIFQGLAARTDKKFTVSAGLLLCPMGLPLRAALRRAHHLERVAKGEAGRDVLAIEAPPPEPVPDDENKEEAGRDALAIEAWSGGGPTLSVARKWDGSGSPDDWVNGLIDLTRRPPRFPSSFLYQSARLMRDLGLSDPHPQLDPDGVSKLIAAEYFGSREREYAVKEMHEAEEKVEPLLRLARYDGVWHPDMLRLVRFFLEEERV